MDWQGARLTPSKPTLPFLRVRVKTCARPRGADSTHGKKVVCSYLCSHYHLCVFAAVKLCPRR